MPDLPTGTVTFLFTDIEGSTRLLGRLGAAYTELLEEHLRLLRASVTAHGGTEVATEGDSLFAVFRSPAGAVAAAVDGQRALTSHPWPQGHDVRVRMGLHTGEGTLGAENYVGLDVHRAARISAAGHGGQILISDATRALVENALPAGASLLDLGEHRLKDLERPERIHQVSIDGLRGSFPALKTLDARIANLPAQLTSFVGRERETEEVAALLEDARLVTLTGPGGTGKTRLSLAVAERLLDRFRDGAAFVGLASLSDPKLVPTTIASAFGLREDPGRPVLDTVIEHLRDRQILLVLDNFEQLIPAGSYVAEILAATGEVRVLVSSREPLNLAGEQEYPVPPLPVPLSADAAPEELPRFAALRLFEQRARAAKPGFELTPANAPVVAEICARLDGLPLAIELAAARVKLLSPEQILQRLENRLSLLAGGRRDVPARQQTLRDAIAWSYDLLDPQERTLFERLSVFYGGFTLDAAEAICTGEIDVFDGLASLVNKSLVRQVDRGDGDARFFLLQTIADFGMEKLTEAGMDQAVKARHARFFLELAEEAAPQLMGERQAELLDLLETEHDNLRAAIDGATRGGETEVALRLGAALWRFWQMRGHLREAASRLERILDLPGWEPYPRARADALEAAGGVHYWMGIEWELVERYYTECLELRRAIGDPAGIAEALYNLAFAFVIAFRPEREPARGVELYGQALELFRRLGDTRGEAKALWGLANAHLVQREWTETHEVAESALELFRRLDDRFGQGWALYTMGMARVGLGDPDGAEEVLRRSLELGSAVDDISAIALVVSGVAMVSGIRGDAERAARLWGAATALESRAGVGLIRNWDPWMPWQVASLLEVLSQEELDRLLAEGAAFRAEEAIALALGDG